MKYPLPTFAVVLTLLIGHSTLSAVTVWNFSTTGGGDTISGTLTTDGTPTDLASPRNFQIQSIDTLLLNGSPVLSLATGLPWVQGTTASISTSPLIWDGTAVVLPIFILAESVPGGDLLEIDNNPDPDFPNFKARIQGLVEFETTSTEIVPIRTPVNVPDAGSSLGLLALSVSMLGLVRRFKPVSRS